MTGKPETDFCGDHDVKCVDDDCKWTGKLRETFYYDGTRCPSCGDYVDEA